MKSIPIKDMELAEWRLHRTAGIGGSDIGAICGVNKYRTPLSVWYEKTGQAEPPEMNKHMDWGTRLEDVIAEKFEDETGMKTRKTNYLYLHGTFPEYRCNPDRFILQGSAPEGCAGRGILSIKMGSSYSFKDGLVPLSYLYQLQWEMYVTGYNWGYIAWWETDTREFHYRQVLSDDNLINRLEMAARLFWKNVLANTPPDPMLSDIESMVVDAEGPTLTATNDLKKAIRNYSGYKVEQKVFEDLAKLEQEKIKQLVGGHAKVVDDEGEVILTYTTSTRKAFTVPEKNIRTLRIKERKEK